MVDFGEVAERSNATDCKSVALAASEVRILPSPPACVYWRELRQTGFSPERRLGAQGVAGDIRGLVVQFSVVGGGG